MKQKMLLILVLLSIWIGAVQAADITTHTTADIMVAPVAESTSLSQSSIVSSSGSESPDYDAVFLQDRVQRIDIKISPENWQKMLDNMTEQVGEFGENSFPMNGEISPMEMGGKGPGEVNQSMMKKMETNPISVPATISLNGKTIDNVGIRFKGASSLSGSWRSGTYKISLKLNMGEYKTSKDDSDNSTLFGFKKLNLQSGFSDNSLLKDKMAYEILSNAGIPSPKSAFYQVYIDTGNGPEYFGLYTMVEDVADTMIKNQFTNASGNLYKADSMGDIGSLKKGSQYKEGYEKENNKKDNDYSDLTQLYTTLNSNIRITDPETWRSQLESIFNVDEFLTWLATNQLIKNWDTYGSMSHNYYLYNDPETGTFTWIPWDYNLAFQNASNGMEGSENMSFPSGDNLSLIQENKNPGFDGANISKKMGMGFKNTTFNLSSNEISADWPLIRYLLDDPVYHEKYVEAVKTVSNGAFDPNTLKETFSKNHELISPYVVGPDGERAKYTHLKSDQDFEDSLNKLISHVFSQYDAAVAYVSDQEHGGNNYSES
ncbi:CotH kinase family protein [uncultured Methanospirillum sp.]|uniref:CotH kinase family protein n=1 Tax=uncultured Methanospirillum sp. TaxID=262503 RepID=UPI0029C79EF9|nr:CotH kinase family protein [uncultured Methanospirillum sp.]